MAFIRTIPESEASGRLAELYRRAGNPDGTVDNVMKIHSLSADALEAHFQLYVAAMHKRSPLSRIEREIVGSVVSRENGCAYCATHHTAGLARLLGGQREDLPEQLSVGDDSGLSPRERAMVGYALKLTRNPSAVSRDDIEALREAGLDDRAIHDLAQVVAYFCYANRMVTGLGVVLEDAGVGQHPSVQDDAD